MSARRTPDVYQRPVQHAMPGRRRIRAREGAGDRRRRHPRADPRARARRDRAPHRAADRRPRRPDRRHLDRRRSSPARSASPTRCRPPRSPRSTSEEGPKIFDRSLLKPITSRRRLPRRALRRRRAGAALERHLGDTRLTTRPRAAPADRLRHRGARRSTSCAPRASDRTPRWSTPRTPPRPRRPTSSRSGSAARTLIDGGVFAINPALVAYAEVGGTLDLLLSLGTG